MTQITLLITSGHGPGECQQAAAGVLERLLEDAKAHDLDSDVTRCAGKHGLHSAVVVLHGLGVADFAAQWCGTIQWRAKSTLRPHHKRGNWFIGVFNLPQRTLETVDVQTSDVRFESFRAGGPGGQHQNTTDSAVRATHLQTGLTVVAREMRSQHRNKALALDRLRALVAGQAAADRAVQRGDQNQLHTQLERGNPVRCFKGSAFKEVRC